MQERKKKDLGAGLLRKKKPGGAGGGAAARGRERVSGGDHGVTIRTWIEEAVPGQD